MNFKYKFQCIFTNIHNKEISEKVKDRIKFFILLLFIISPSLLFAQDSKVSLSLNNADIKQLFETIEKQTKYRFSYRDADLLGKDNITIVENDKSVSVILNEVLSSLKLEYKISGNKIIIIPVPNKSAEGIRVTGNIKDNVGEPLIGVSVTTIGGKGVGAISDTNGDFTLPNIPANSQLQFSFIGYETQVLKAQSVINITMVEDARLLDEVVVVGYGVQKKINLSGAVATVSTKQLENRPVINIGQALQGTVANLNVSIGSGQAIDSPSFNIRGQVSLGGGSPLIVIDGIIADKDQLNRMNPNDIGSISILKDAASAAIYGSRAAFGVILVTTKEGTSDKLKVNYNNNFSIKKITRMPDIVTDPYDVAVTRNIMGAPWYHLYDDEKLAYAKKVSEDPSTPPYYLNPDGSYTFFGQTDWIDEAYKSSGFSTSHSVDISGKADKLVYYFSAGYNFNDGMIRYGTDKYNRYNLRSKMDFKITDNWRISNNTNFVTSDYTAPSYLGSSYYWEINRLSPLSVLRNPDGTWTSEGASVLGILDEGGKWKKDETTVSTHFNTRIDFIKDVLFAQGNFAYTVKKNKEKWHYLPVAYFNGVEKEAIFKNPISSAHSTNFDSPHLLFDAYLTFIKTFAKKHAITAMAGFNQEEYRSESNSMSRKDLISTSLPSMGLATGERDLSESISTWAVRSGYGRLNYTFNDRYILEFNARYDGTSRFAKDSRFTFNPSGSVAWVASREKFFEPLLPVVSFFKLRGSYGVLGNQDVSNYAYLATMDFGKIGRILDGTQPMAVYAPGLVSPGLTWEKVSTVNVGVDVNFLSNRLSISGDIYERQTKDMLMPGQTLPAVLGTGVPKENAADLKTNGWEITTTWKDEVMLAGKAFRYSVGFNLADSKAEITRFENPKGLLKDPYVGKRLGEVWGLTTLGFFTSQDDIKNHADQTPVTSYPGVRPIEPGDLKFEDRNGDKVIDKGAETLDDHGDYHIIGNTSARYTYGITASAEWNNIDFSCFFQGVGKKDYFPGGAIHSFGDLFTNHGLISQKETL